MEISSRIARSLALACAALIAASLAGAAGANVTARGTLVVAVDTSSAPYSSVGADGQTVVGLDADLAQALANAIGYRLRVVAAEPGAIVPGLRSGEYDVAMPFAGAAAKDVDLLPYLAAGTALYTAAGSKAPAELCGRSIAVVRGSAQAAAAAARSRTCTATRRPALRVVAFTGAAAAERALASGRVQVVMTGTAAATATVKRSDGRLRLADAAPSAIAIPAGDAMAAELLDALKTVIADGTYGSILTKWGARPDAISTPHIESAAA